MATKELDPTEREKKLEEAVRKAGNINALIRDRNSLKGWMATISSRIELLRSARNADVYINAKSAFSVDSGTLIEYFEAESEKAFDNLRLIEDQIIKVSS